MKTSMRVASLAVAATLWLVVLRIVRPWYLQWGATDIEVARVMPLDDRIPEPFLKSTMAITIRTTPEHIWPCIARMGDPPRPGYYTYTWIERMAGMRIENRDVMLMEFQEVRAGDVLDKNGTMSVLSVEPGTSLVLGPPESVEEVQCTWAFGIYPLNGRSSRLVTRVRGRMNYRALLRKAAPLSWPLYILIGPGAFIMERKMLLEIRRRAEGAASRNHR
jgi:hypothetical protein